MLNLIWLKIAFNPTPCFSCISFSSIWIPKWHYTLIHTMDVWTGCAISWPTRMSVCVCVGGRLFFPFIHIQNDYKLDCVHNVIPRQIQNDYRNYKLVACSRPGFVAPFNAKMFLLMKRTKLVRLHRFLSKSRRDTFHFNWSHSVIRSIVFGWIFHHFDGIFSRRRACECGFFRFFVLIIGEHVLQKLCPVIKRNAKSSQSNRRYFPNFSNGKISIFSNINLYFSLKIICKV